MEAPTDDMPRLPRVPRDLPELVRNAFRRACDSGDVNFYPTQVTLLDVNSIPVCAAITFHPLPSLSTAPVILMHHTDQM